MQYKLIYLFTCAYFTFVNNELYKIDTFMHNK